MNDYLEVEHGLGCFHSTSKCPARARFNKLIDNCFPGLAAEVDQDFSKWEESVREESYITCLSEHPIEEDQNGRLSMWRAYGETAGVALVLNSGSMHSHSHELNVYSSPVAYLTIDEFQAEFEKIVKDAENEAAFIKSLGREKVRNAILKAFFFTVLCTKHPGFHEEREWRVIATTLLPPTSQVTQSVEVVRGIPQIVRKFGLKTYSNNALNLAIPKLLDRIIIGPCAFPEIVHGAFLKLLQDAGVSDPERMVIVSGIPLRHL
ncbi:MAG: DUF2971 domain-containing protein [Nitrospira sp.]|nr:DUF2971 domain-containing protein [Nitrospira sp.]